MKKPFNTPEGVLQLNCERFAKQQAITMTETSREHPALFKIEPDLYVFFGQKLSRAGINYLFSRGAFHYIQITSVDQFINLLRELKPIEEY